jgi:hypothetical protein
MSRKARKKSPGERPLHASPAATTERVNYMTKAKTKGGFDLASIDTIAACNKPAEVEIRHPVTDDPTGVFISILGKDSDSVRKRVRAFADEEMQSEAMGRDVDTGERRIISTMIAATTGWRTGDQPHVTLNGEALPFTPENAEKVYSGILPVRDQVYMALFNLSLFMKG